MVATSKHIDLAIVDIIAVILNRVCLTIFYKCFHNFFDLLSFDEASEK